MELKFLEQLEEGKALSRVGQLNKYDVNDVLRLLFLELGAALMFQNEKTAQHYASTTVSGGSFNRWRLFGTDLYNAATALNNSEYRAKMGANHGIINVPLLQKLLRDISNGRGRHTDYAKFTMDSQRSFGSSDAVLTALRRRIADYESLSQDQRQQLLSDMGRYYAPFGGRGDMLSVSSEKSNSGPLRSFLKWAVKMGLIAWAGYEFGKRIGR